MTRKNRGKRILHTVKKIGGDRGAIIPRDSFKLMTISRKEAVVVTSHDD